MLNTRLPLVATLVLLLGLLITGVTHSRAGGPGQYVVKNGDNVAKIADFFGVSQNDLRRENNLSKNDFLKVGSRISIPKHLRNGGKGHVVRKGDTLAGIAKKHKVTVKALAAANKLYNTTRLQPGRTLVIPVKELKQKQKPRKSPKLVKSGEKIPGGVLHRVMPGQTLWIIARAYNVDKERIAKRNNISVTDSLKVGQKIKVPGAKAVVPVRVKGFSIQPIHFVRVKTGDELSVRLVKNNGAVIPYARKKLTRFASPLSRKQRKNTPLFHRRLIQMLQRVAERYPGRTFEIISGYRKGAVGGESRHATGQAIDFRVRGISNLELYNFCTELPNAGCGYYPNSVFIHMDSREQSATWTDYSKPGEKARYKKANSGSKQSSQ